MSFGLWATTMPNPSPARTRTGKSPWPPTTTFNREARRGRPIVDPKDSTRRSPAELLPAGAAPNHDCSVSDNRRSRIRLAWAASTT
jgi:hypothetical protein